MAGVVPCPHADPPRVVPRRNPLAIGRKASHRGVRLVPLEHVRGRRVLHGAHDNILALRVRQQRAVGGDGQVGRRPAHGPGSGGVRAGVQEAGLVLGLARGGEARHEGERYARYGGEDLRFVRLSLSKKCDVRHAQRGEGKS